MKYFTREWYEIMRCSQVINQLNITSQAEYFSEEYYRQLYMRRLTEYVEQMKELAYEAGETFSRAKAELKFRIKTEQLEQKFNQHMSEEMLEQVADLRVLSLGSASMYVYTQIEKCCQQKQEDSEAVGMAYWQYFDEIYAKIPTHLRATCENALQDRVITKMKTDDDQIVMTYCNDIWGRARICFCGVERFETDGDLVGSTWLYDEIYPFENGGAQIDVLFVDDDLDEVIECSICCNKTKILFTERDYFLNWYQNYSKNPESYEDEIGEIINRKILAVGYIHLKPWEELVRDFLSMKESFLFSRMAIDGQFRVGISSLLSDEWDCIIRNLAVLWRCGERELVPLLSALVEIRRCDADEQDKMDGFSRVESKLKPAILERAFEALIEYVYQNKLYV